jgi:hypothetical protein
MSRHISRKERWTRRDAKQYSSEIGEVVYRQDAWYARLTYELRSQVPTEGTSHSWVGHEQWIGPCKRPRNAMVELEREIAVLRNRHGNDVRIGKEIEPS